MSSSSVLLSSSSGTVDTSSIINLCPVDIDKQSSQLKSGATSEGDLSPIVLSNPPSAICSVCEDEAEQVPNPNEGMLVAYLHQSHNPYDRLHLEKKQTATSNTVAVHDHNLQETSSSENVRVDASDGNEDIKSVQELDDMMAAITDKILLQSSDEY